MTHQRDIMFVFVLSRYFMKERKYITYIRMNWKILEIRNTISRRINVSGFLSKVEELTLLKRKEKINKKRITDLI